MRFIPIDNLPEEYNKINGDGSFALWLAEAEYHLNNIRDLLLTQRSQYWSNYNIWTKLYTTLSSLSEHKCWYSEAPENSSEWEIDHFRPKAQSKQENKIIIRDDGYWWLSYYWKNFRLAGSLVNKLRKDRFESNNNDVLGKGNFFPLENNSPIAQIDDMYCTCERPMLLDPTSVRDCSLLTYDESGDVFPRYSSADDLLKHERAKISIECYGLNHTPLKRGRTAVWQSCERLIDETNNFLVVYISNNQDIERKISSCYSELVRLTDKTTPYSMVVKNFLFIKSKQYGWLEEIVTVMQ
ncbi:hypothetical protein EZS27_028628 [termite gut metagenome]|uniref:HNH nuclease domain-containing protein n=1 Tax=termite gut metagenome TaxID=433724 RepID=A0A5J4QKD6_9ZZZZ